MEDLEAYKLGDAPSLFYIPNFLDEEKQNEVWDEIYERGRWRQAPSGRRLQNIGGIPHEKGMAPEELPLWLRSLAAEIQRRFAFFPHEPQHALVNEYEPGHGIMPHEDGPVYHPFVAIVSLGSDILFDLIAKNNEGDYTNTQKVHASLLLERGSLLLFKDSLYTEYFHGIDSRSSDTLDELTLNPSDRVPIGASFERQRRVSITIRSVKKVIPARLLSRLMGRT